MNDLAAALRSALAPLVDELVSEAIARRLGDGGRVEWLTVEEYAVLKRTTPAAVHKRLERGQVPGAVRDGRRWLIPAAPEADTVRERPQVGRAPLERPRPGTER